MINEREYLTLSQIDKENNNSYYEFINVIKERASEGDTFPTSHDDGWIFRKIDPLTPSRKIFFKLLPSSQMFLIRNLHSSSSHNNLSNVLRREVHDSSLFIVGDDYYENEEFEESEDHEDDFEESDDDNDGGDIGKGKRKKKQKRRRNKKFNGIVHFSELMSMNKVCRTLYDYLFIRLKFSPSTFFSNLFEYRFERDGGEGDEGYQKEVMNHYTFNVFYRFETFSDCFLFLNVYNNFYTKLIQYKVPRLEIEKCFVPITHCNECVCFRGIDAADTVKNNNAIEKYVTFILQPRIIGGGGGDGENFSDRRIKRKRSRNMMEQSTLFKKRAAIINLDPNSTLKIFDFCHSNEYSISPILKFHVALLFLKNTFPIKTLKNISGKIFNSVRYKTFF